MRFGPPSDIGYYIYIERERDRERERYTSRYIIYGVRCGPPPIFLSFFYKYKLVPGCTGTPHDMARQRQDRCILAHEGVPGILGRPSRAEIC